MESRKLYSRRNFSFTVFPVNLSVESFIFRVFVLIITLSGRVLLAQFIRQSYSESHSYPTKNLLEHVPLSPIHTHTHTHTHTHCRERTHIYSHGSVNMS